MIERCTSVSPNGESCVLAAGHGIRHCGPRPEDGSYRERWGDEETG